VNADMTSSSQPRTAIDPRIRAGAIAWGLAALMTVPAVFAVQPPSDPAHNREFALGANTASFRLANALQIYALTPLILGMFALYAVIARSSAPRLAFTGLVVTVVGAGCLLPGTGFSAFVVPAAGVLISQGHDQDVLWLLDQVFEEPGWIPVFIGGLLYFVGLLVTSVAIWRSKTMARWYGALLAVATLVGVPTFLDVTQLARVSDVLWIAASGSLAFALWRHTISGGTGE
jgi:hypothetical protein